MLFLPFVQEYIDGVVDEFGEEVGAEYVGCYTNLLPTHVQVAIESKDYREFILEVVWAYRGCIRSSFAGELVNLVESGRVVRFDSIQINFQQMVEDGYMGRECLV